MAVDKQTDTPAVAQSRHLQCVAWPLWMPCLTANPSKGDESRYESHYGQSIIPLQRLFMTLHEWILHDRTVIMWQSINRSGATHELFSKCLADV